MKFINNDSGDIFEDEDEARQDALEDMTYEDYASYIRLWLSYEELLKWAFQHNFVEEYCGLFSEAEEEFFTNRYTEYEDEEEEEDF